jgi:cyclomaltodextrinase
MTQNQFPAWVKDAVFYQIFPERFANGDPGNDPKGLVPWDSKPELNSFFGGDLQGIRDHIPYLKDLGINAVYLTPIFKAASNHKYDTINYFEIDPNLGSNDLFIQLVQEFHEVGIRVVLDGVFNHCGDQNPKFIDAFERGPSSPYYDWFMFQAPKEIKSYQTCGGADFLPKLNTSNPEVQNYILDVATFWIEKAGVDGWRLDVPWKADPSLWSRFYEHVKALNKEIYVVHETWRDSSFWLNRGIGDAVMNYLLRDFIFDYALKDSMDAEDFNYFVQRLLDDYREAAPYQLNLLGSHDTARLLTIADGNIPRVLIAYTLLFTLPGAPMLYYGDENGMVGENDPDCRRGMIWDEKFWNQEIRQRLSKLIDLRKALPALTGGEYKSLLNLNGVHAFSRGFADDQVIIVTNPREATGEILIPTDLPNETWQDLLGESQYQAVKGFIRLPDLSARSAFILIPTKKSI